MNLQDARRAEVSDSHVCQDEMSCHSLMSGKENDKFSKVDLGILLHNWY